MNIHCIGIGGIGLSGLAQVLGAQGHRVQGSDRESGKVFPLLRKRGIKVYAKHDSKLVARGDIDLVIYSLAIPGDHREVKEARKRKIRILSYPQALGELTSLYKTIAVAGTHGKTTTTAMLAKILIDAGVDPTVIVGSTVPELGNSNCRVGKSDMLVVEACEYQKGFLNLHPFGVILTTTDYDHFDTYPTRASYVAVFKKFIKKITRGGFLIKGSSVDGKIKLGIPGIHNRKNATLALRAAVKLGVPQKKALKSLLEYRGSGRRFEYKYSKSGVRFYDDYAHHPTEIRATLEAAREIFPKKKICVIYQPHQYSRTRKILKELGSAFDKADMVIVPNIYEARDSAADKKAVSAQDVVAEINKHRKHSALFGAGLDNTRKGIGKYYKLYDVIITMGAGDVWKVL